MMTTSLMSPQRTTSQQQYQPATATSQSLLLLPYFIQQSLLEWVVDRRVPDPTLTLPLVNLPQ